MNNISRGLDIANKFAGNGSNNLIEKLTEENMILRAKYGYNGMFYSLNFSSTINIVFVIVVLLLIIFFYLNITSGSTGLFNSAKEKIESFDGGDDVSEEFGL